MVKNLLKHLKAKLSVVVLGIAITAYSLLTLPALFTTNHLLLNLEPYPDGMLYALSARNTILDKGMQLVYGEETIKMWVPQLYAAVLVPIYLISAAPQLFYLTNVLLGIASIFLLWVLLRKTTNSVLAQGVGLILYLSHAYIVWLPTVPMTENLVLPLFLLALYALVIPKPSNKELAISACAIAGLLFTRYSIITIVGILGIWWLYIVLKDQSKKIKLTVLSASLVAGLLFVGYLSTLQTSPLSILENMQKELSKDSGFYSFSYITPNAIRYTQIIFGQNTQLLWQLFPFTSAAISFVAILGLLATIFLRQNLTQLSESIQEKMRWLLLIFFAQFPLLLIFYTVDARYIFLTIPLFVVICSWLVETLQTRFIKNAKILFTGLLIILGFHIFTQAPLLKQVISNNVLHRSTAWQYQAIQHFSEFANENTNQADVTIITALPPFLVDAYQTGNYRVLPLSQSQEFLQKGEYVWGDDVPYQDLLSGYAEWLQQGKTLYISNAYITHQQSVISDYEQFREQFNLELVSSGCMEACNIYKISRK